MSRILVIEDNSTNMKLVRELLEHAGFAVLEATDAEGGIALALEERPDLILMDVNLPGSDGLAATRLLRQSNSPIAQTPIIALTAHAMPDDEQKALDAGCDAYLAKPLRYQQLIATISRFIDGEPS